MRLLEQINSHIRKGHIYGEKGDTVTLIADMDGVLIVEDKKGKRFPVKKENVR